MVVKRFGDMKNWDVYMPKVLAAAPTVVIIVATILGIYSLHKIERELRSIDYEIRSLNYETDDLERTTTNIYDEVSRIRRSVEY